MKKSVLLALVIFISILFYSCEREGHNIKTEIRYSNLADKASVQVVRIALERAGFSSRVIKEFFDEVKAFNELIEYTDLSKGFIKTDDTELKYDTVQILTLIEKKQPLYTGYNSRLTSYALMRDFIELEGTHISTDDNSIDMDMHALKDKPNLFTKEEVSIYKSLFSHIETENTGNMKVHLENIKENFKQKGLKFKNGDKASLILVIFHYSDEVSSDLFIGHAGILIPHEEAYLYIEKLNFEEPYQALIFNSKLELNDYLMNKYDVRWGHKSARPFILENGELLEGFRENPKLNGR